MRVGGDLVISAFDAPAAGGVGVPLTLGDTTRNTGASAIGASATNFYLSADSVLTTSDALLGTRSVEALSADHASAGSTPVAIPAGTASGYYYLFARADGGNLVSETQEGNNGAIRSFSIGPDLIVSITSTPWPILPGIAALVKDNVSNRGGGEAGPSVVMYYLSTNYIARHGGSVACKPIDWYARSWRVKRGIAFYHGSSRHGTRILLCDCKGRRRTDGRGSVGNEQQLAAADSGELRARSGRREGVKVIASGPTGRILPTRKSAESVARESTTPRVIEPAIRTIVTIVHNIGTIRLLHQAIHSGMRLAMV